MGRFDGRLDRSARGNSIQEFISLDWANAGYAPVRKHKRLSGGTHVRAVSNSLMLGQIVVKIDYRDYHIQLRPPV